MRFRFVKIDDSDFWYKATAIYKVLDNTGTFV